MRRCDGPLSAVNWRSLLALQVCTAVPRPAPGERFWPLEEHVLLFEDRSCIPMSEEDALQVYALRFCLSSWRATHETCAQLWDGQRRQRLPTASHLSQWRAVSLF